MPLDTPEPRCALREVKALLHQASFRDAVLAAYEGRCAIPHLPEAAARPLSLQAGATADCRAIAVDRAARLCSRHAVGAIPSAMATSAIPITTAAISTLNLGSITPRSAIKEGMAKCFGVEAAATRAPIGVPAPAVAVQRQLPLS